MAEEIDDYRTGGSWYEFPDGTKVQGKDEARQYLEDLKELDEIAEEEAALDELEEASEGDTADAEELAVDESNDSGALVTSDQATDTEPDDEDAPLVAGKPDAKPREVVDAADGDPDADEPTDNKNTPGDRKEYLVEMTRNNRMFEYSGKEKNYLFRHDARILVVKAEDVDGLTSQGGFRVVTPDQAKAYYS